MLRWAITQKFHHPSCNIPPTKNQGERQIRLAIFSVKIESMRECGIPADMRWACIHLAELLYASIPQQTTQRYSPTDFATHTTTASMPMENSSHTTAIWNGTLVRRGIARQGLFMLCKVAIMVGEAEVLLCLLGIPTSCRPQAKRIPHLQLECSLDATADFLRRGKT